MIFTRILYEHCVFKKIFCFSAICCKVLYLGQHTMFVSWLLWTELYLVIAVKAMQTVISLVYKYI